MTVALKEPPKIVCSIPYVGSWRQEEWIATRSSSDFRGIQVKTEIKSSRMSTVNANLDMGYTAIFDSINSFITLPNNWDGNGSGPVSHEVVKNAASLTAGLITTGFDVLLAYPLGDQGIQIDAKSNTVSVELEVYANKTKCLLFDEDSNLIESFERNFDALVTI
jgi:hypothetical protein